MEPISATGRIKKASEKIHNVGPDGSIEATAEVTIALRISRREYLRIARAQLHQTDLEVTISAADFQMSLDVVLGSN